MLVKLDTSTLTDEPGGHRDADAGVGLGPTPAYTVIYTGKLHHERGRYLLRHAQAIDEDRARFPRVGWGRSADLQWHRKQGREDWLVQVWFAGNHSDIGGSYPEEESRLSDIALHWMVDETKAALGDAVKVHDERLVTTPDALSLQHSERTGMLNAQPALFRWLTSARSCGARRCVTSSRRRTYIRPCSSGWLLRTSRRWARSSRTGPKACARTGTLQHSTLITAAPLTSRMLACILCEPDSYLTHTRSLKASWTHPKPDARSARLNGLSAPPAK